MEKHKAPEYVKCQNRIAKVLSVDHDVKGEAYYYCSNYGWIKASEVEAVTEEEIDNYLNSLINQ